MYNNCTILYLLNFIYSTFYLGVHFFTSDWKATRCSLTIIGTFLTPTTKSTLSWQEKVLDKISKLLQLDCPFSHWNMPYFIDKYISLSWQEILLVNSQRFPNLCPLIYSYFCYLVNKTCYADMNMCIVIITMVAK